MFGPETASNIGNVRECSEILSGPSGNVRKRLRMFGAARCNERKRSESFGIVGLAVRRRAEMRSGMFRRAAQDAWKPRPMLDILRMFGHVVCAIRKCSEVLAHVRSHVVTHGNVRKCSDMFGLAGLAVRECSEMLAWLFRRAARDVRKPRAMFGNVRKSFLSHAEMFGHPCKCLEPFAVTQGKSEMFGNVGLAVRGCSDMLAWLFRRAARDVRKPRAIGGVRPAVGQHPRPSCSLSARGGNRSLRSRPAAPR